MLRLRYLFSSFSVLTLVLLGACDQKEEDVIPINKYQVRLGDDAFSVAADSTVRLAVFDNDLIELPAELSVDAPAHGSVTIAPDGLYYTAPAPGRALADSFRYQASTALGLHSALVRITLVQPGCLPVAQPDTARTLMNNSLSIALLANDEQCTGAIATLRQAPRQGQVQLLPSGQASYQPNPGFVGFDSFVYQLCAGGACSQATVYLSVDPDPACALALQPRNDQASTIAGGTLVLPKSTLMANDLSCTGDLDQGSFALVGTAQAGTVQEFPDRLVYTAPAFATSDTLHYRVCSSSHPATCQQASIVITVN